MVRRNPERRRALLDAAIDVLAQEGARGLTFRAVDARAGVPTGTASNYFADRAQLLLQAGAHVHVRLTPAEEFMASFSTAAPSREQTRAGMHDLLRRIRADRSGYLALLELRLEANRHPGIRAAVLHDSTEARLTRAHNDANVAAFGARLTGPEVALDALAAFLATPYEGGRHARRLDKLSPPQASPSAEPKP